MDMRPLRNLSTLPFAVAMLIPAAHGQSGSFSFQHGEWQVNSTVSADGRTVSLQQSVCAQGASDFWKQQRLGMQCDAPAMTSAPGGVHVRLACQGSTGPISWKMQSDVTEIFSQNGRSFTATGSTTTTTSMPGGASNTATATMLSKGTYQGACVAGK
jgi:hypothetical protein